MNSSLFVTTYLVEEVIAMKEAGIKLQLLSAMVHGVETAGALLDDKPFKAKGQGRKRFDLALKKLFSSEYTKANLKANLYNQLRSHMAHCMIPAKTILLSEDYDHLSEVNGQRSISIETLFKDYTSAMTRLLNLIEENKLKNKHIEFNVPLN